MSASSMPTRAPSAASASARLTAAVRLAHAALARGHRNHVLHARQQLARRAAPHGRRSSWRRPTLTLPTPGKRRRAPMTSWRIGLQLALARIAPFSTSSEISLPSTRTLRAERVEMRSRPVLGSMTVRRAFGNLLGGEAAVRPDSPRCVCDRLVGVRRVMREEYEGAARGAVARAVRRALQSSVGLQTFTSPTPRALVHRAACASL